MSLLRSAALARSVLLRPGKKAPVHQVTTAVRHSGDGSFTYRNLGDSGGSQTLTRATDALFTVFWTWVFYHTIVRYDHITGEYEYPDPSKWTDEELGVPPDDYEPPSRY